MRFLLVALIACSHPAPSLIETLSRPMEPVRVVGNIYDVGAVNIASYVIATPDGLIMIDSGTPAMTPQILHNLDTAGLHLRDIKILLCSHAHFDHVGGHAAIARASGARVMVMREDADAVRTGTDESPLADEGWQPVKIDRELVDGDTVELGGTTLRAIRTPGHTPGCTVWTTTTHEQDRDYSVVFYGCMRPNDGVKLRGNARFPNLIAETQASFRRMRELTPDIFLQMHPDEQLGPVMAQLRAGVRPHPLANPAAWPKFLGEAETEFAEIVRRDAGGQ